MPRLRHLATILAFSAAIAAGFSAAPADEEPRADRFVPLDLQAKANQDLEADFHGYPGNNLQPLPQGRQELGGVEFQIGPKMIQLAGKRAPDWPEAVEGIPIGCKLDRLHLLHATGWGSPGVPDGTLIGRFVVHYDDGSTETIPIEYGHDVRDWWALGDSLPASKGKAVWTGVNEASRDFRGMRVEIRLYKSTWDNPHPEKAIERLDYQSTNETSASPFLVAATAETAEDEAGAVRKLEAVGALLEGDDEGRVVGVTLAGSGPRADMLRGTDAVAALLAHLPRLERADLASPSITDAALAHLSDRPHLRSLSLNNARVTDEGLAHLAGLESLERLHLHGTGITDEGLRHLAALKGVRFLDLSGTRVSDEGLDQLRGLSNLERLDVRGTQVTPSGAETLQETLPDLNVSL